MSFLMQLDIHVSRVEVKALLRLSLEEHHISLLHPLLQLKLQIPRSDDDLLSPTDRTLIVRPKASASTVLALHIHFFNVVFDLYFSRDLSRTSASRTRFLDSTEVSSSFAVFADLSSPEAIDLVPSRVKLFQRNPHFSPKVSSFPQRILLELFKSLLSMQVVGNSRGYIDQCLVGSFDLNIPFLDLLVACMTVRVVLD